MVAEIYDPVAIIAVAISQSRLQPTTAASDKPTATVGTASGKPTIVVGVASHRRAATRRWLMRVVVVVLQHSCSRGCNNPIKGSNVFFCHTCTHAKKMLQ